MLHHNYIPIQSILFDRKLYERYGGFDESLENLEDWNLWTRYCLNNDFLLIEKTTSMYRVPDSLNQLISRKQLLDSYYNLAVEKQKELKLTVTSQEVINFYQDMVNYQNMFNYERIKVSNKSKLKSFIFKYDFLKKIYFFLSVVTKNKK
jgi:hypothetical protein